MYFLICFILLFISCDKNSSAPDENLCCQCVEPNCWNLDIDGILDNYNQYQFNGSITSAVINEGISIVGPGDVFAAFVDEELRGVAVPTEVPFGNYEGTYQFLMLIYSNSSSGELIHFKFYDSDLDLVYNITQNNNFISDMIQGDVLNPLLFNIIN